MPPRKSTELSKHKKFVDPSRIKTFLSEDEQVMRFVTGHVILSLNSAALKLLLDNTGIKLSTPSPFMQGQDLRQLCQTIIPSPKAHATLQVIFDQLKSELTEAEYTTFVAQYNPHLVAIASSASNHSLNNLQLLVRYGVNFDTTLTLQSAPNHITTPLKLAIVRKQEDIARFIAQHSSKESLLTPIQGSPPIDYAHAYGLKKLEKYIFEKTKIPVSAQAKYLPPPPTLQTLEFKSVPSNITVGELISYIEPRYGSFQEYTVLIKNLLQSAREKQDTEDISSHLLLLSLVAYEALIKDNTQIFLIIEDSIKSLLTNPQNYKFLITLYNISIIKNNEIDNIKASGTALSKALEIFKDEKIEAMLAPDTKASLFYNKALLDIRYHKFDQALEAINTFETLVPQDPDIRTIKEIFTIGISNYTQYIPQLRFAEQVQQILGEYNEPAEIMTKIRNIGDITEDTKREAELEELIGTQKVPEYAKTFLQGLSNKADNIAHFQRKILEINAQGDKVFLIKVILYVLYVNFISHNPTKALEKLEFFDQKLPGVLQNHTDMQLAKLVFLIHSRNNDLKKALDSLKTIHSLWTTLTEVGFNTQYDSQDIIETTAKQYMAQALSSENYYMAKQGIPYLPQAAREEYGKIIKAREDAQKHPSPASETITLEKELGQATEEGSTPARAEARMEEAIEFGFEKRIEKPVTSSPLPYSLAALSTLVDTDTIKVTSLHPAIQNIYFGYSSLLLKQHNIEMLAPHNLSTTWLVHQKQYVYNPNSPNNAIYHITHNLYATIAEEVLDTLDPATANQFKQAIATCRITREFGQHGIKFLSQNHYELKIALAVRMTGDIFENPAKKQLIEFNKIHTHKEVARTEKHEVIKVSTIESHVTETGDSDSAFYSLEEQYFHLLGKLGEHAIIGALDWVSEEL